MLTLKDDFYLTRWKDGFQLNQCATLHQHKNSLDSNELFALPFNVFILNCETTILKVNTAAASTCGFISESDAIGRTIHEVAKKETAENIIDNYKKFLRHQAYFINEEDYWRLDGLNFSTTTIKFPLYDTSKKKAGLLGFSLLNGIETNYTLATGLSWLIDKNLLQNPHLHQKTFFEFGFTSREDDIAKLIIRGKTAKGISERLSLSYRTVENYIASMKQKTNTVSKSELVELLIENT